MSTRTSTSGSTEPGGPPATDRGWLGLHAYYHGDADPLLTGWLGPLVHRLRTDGLTSGHFFIRYWQEGDHVRLRLRPAPGVRPGTVTALVEDGIADFLLRRPSTQVSPPPDAVRRRAFYLAEYDRSSWDRLYGPDGDMPWRDNNSWRWVDYEPEFGRYGGPHGVELAEWHFGFSSDLVLAVLSELSELAEPPGPPRSRRLGIAARLGLIMCAAFLDADEDVADVLTAHRDFWHDRYGLGHPDRAYRGRERMSDRLRLHVPAVTALARGGAVDEPDRLLSAWAWHCRELRRRVTDLVAQGRYLPSGDQVAVVRDPARALRDLLPSLVHMTNNRLGIRIAEEAYLSHLTAAALTPLPACGPTHEPAR